MDVDVTPNQQALIRHAIATGGVQSAEDAVKEALALWEERERGRAEVLASLNDARALFARGEGLPITQSSMQKLAEDVQQRGRERVAAERSAPICWRIASRPKPARTSTNPVRRRRLQRLME